jgi:choline dehydrogenase-like flavoprotein
LPWGHGHHNAFLERFGHTVSLTVTTEDLPEEDNRIDLDPVLKDSSGIPAPRFRYRVSENTRRMIDHGIGSATRAFQEAGASRIHTQQLLSYTGFHLLGTACMGTDPTRSVVDADCRAHDCDNLFIIDGSVFVTAAALNPTPTIQAIALRTADRIIATRRRRQSTSAATSYGWRQTKGSDVLPAPAYEGSA